MDSPPQDRMEIASWRVSESDDISASVEVFCRGVGPPSEPRSRISPPTSQSTACNSPDSVPAYPTIWPRSLVAVAALLEPPGCRASACGEGVHLRVGRVSVVASCDEVACGDAVTRATHTMGEKRRAPPSGPEAGARARI